jgi:O-antigen/teichoic acid export membrane protein
VLAVGLFFWSLGNVYGYANLGLGKVHYNLFTAVSSGTANVALNLLLVWHFGMIGAAYATACSHVLRFIMNRSFFKAQRPAELRRL